MVVLYYLFFFILFILKIISSCIKETAVVKKGALWIDINIDIKAERNQSVKSTDTFNENIISYDTNKSLRYPNKKNCSFVVSELSFAMCLKIQTIDFNK